jgi:hypothetical protein
MPYWDCDSCGARLYSASESVRWQGCPVCEGTHLTDVDPVPAAPLELPDGESSTPDAL